MTQKVLAGMTMSLDGYVTSLGAIDELTVTIAPVLLGLGKRLFGGAPRPGISFEQAGVIESPFATHLRYRLAHGDIP